MDEIPRHLHLLPKETHIVDNETRIEDIRQQQKDAAEKIVSTFNSRLKNLGTNLLGIIGVDNAGRTWVISQDRLDKPDMVTGRHVNSEGAEMNYPGGTDKDVNFQADIRGRFISHRDPRQTPELEAEPESAMLRIQNLFDELLPESPQAESDQLTGNESITPTRSDQ